jgi:hypothetical protein
MTFQLPKPTADDVFEDLVCDVYRIIFRNPNLQRFGRKGQEQFGIDIIGKDNNTGHIHAIQCKCHTQRSKLSDKLLLEELKSELEKFDNGGIKADMYMFVTSLDASARIQQEVIKVSEERQASGKCRVEIIFWSFIQDHTLEDTELLRKYFFKLLPNAKLENYSIPDFNLRYRSTLSLSYLQLQKDHVDTTRKELLKNIDITLGIKQLDHINEYILSIGIHSGSTSFDSLVDLDICFKEFFISEDDAEKQVAKLEIYLENLLNTIKINGKISNQIVVYLDCEITFAFLIGLALRKCRFIPVFIFKDQAWNTSASLSTVCESNIAERPPKILNPEGSEIIFVYSCNPLINYTSEFSKFNSLSEALGRKQIRFILGYESSEVRNSAHALSISKEIAHKINTLASWGISKIHLVLITPKPLAAEIAYQLNTLNLTIIPYFLSTDRKSYKGVGEITNNFLRNTDGKAQ